MVKILLILVKWIYYFKDKSPGKIYICKKEEGKEIKNGWIFINLFKASHKTHYSIMEKVKLLNISPIIWIIHKIRWKTNTKRLAEKKDEEKFCVHALMMKFMIKYLKQIKGNFWSEINLIWNGNEFSYNLFCIFW